MTALATFLATAKRIEALLGSVADARSIPDRIAADVGNITIYADHARWNYREVPVEAREAAERIKDHLAAEYRADGEHERDAKLYAIAAELQALRAILPQQAAAVAIELGHQARMLQHEANGGTV